MKFPTLSRRIPQSLAERIVVEISNLALLPNGWLWAELDLDQHTELPSSRPPEVRISAATRSSSRQVPDVLRRLRGAAVTHLQFEATRTPATSRAIQAATDEGLATIVCQHLTAAPRSVADLRAHAEALASLGGAVTKLAYWGPTESDWRIAVEVLDSWRHDDMPLSVTPMGTHQGRLAAALAGSRLVFIPLTSDGDRLGADWWAESLRGRPSGPT